jgi:hypothetical protein
LDRLILARVSSDSVMPLFQAGLPCGGRGLQVCPSPDGARPRCPQQRPLAGTPPQPREVRSGLRRGGLRQRLSLLPGQYLQGHLDGGPVLWVLPALFERLANLVARALRHCQALVPGARAALRQRRQEAGPWQTGRQAGGRQAGRRTAGVRPPARPPPPTTPPPRPWCCSRGHRQAQPLKLACSLSTSWLLVGVEAAAACDATRAAQPRGLAARMQVAQRQNRVSRAPAQRLHWGPVACERLTRQLRSLCAATRPMGAEQGSGVASRRHRRHGGQPEPHCVPSVHLPEAVTESSPWGYAPKTRSWVRSRVPRRDCFDVEPCDSQGC